MSKLIRQYNPVKPLVATNGAEVYPVTLPLWDKGEQVGNHTVFVASNGQTSIRGSCLASLASKLNLTGLV